MELRPTEIKMTLTETERMALAIVDELLRKMQDAHADVHWLTSKVTGECIEPDELSRVRGVLGFFEVENQTYEVE